jgi:flagellar basal-body rod protein FlgF
VKLAAEALEGATSIRSTAMVRMISLARQFEMQIKMLQTADANARAASQILTINR